MTNEQLEEAVARLTTITVVRDKDIDDMQSIIRQLWAERDRQRAVMAQAKEAILCMRIGKFFITPHSGEDVIAALKSMGV